ncbi:hypothetical protein BC628DRAFT_780170 [Trametes gibbosa]|nr:hypothetical protein BC628DRAFT_780170 [Trametes gibbosa]
MFRTRRWCSQTAVALYVPVGSGGILPSAGSYDACYQLDHQRVQSRNRRKALPFGNTLASGVRRAMMTFAQFERAQSDDYALTRLRDIPTSCTSYMVCRAWAPRISACADFGASNVRWVSVEAGDA